MTIKYPHELDTGAELPRVDDNITEIGAPALNAMREAIFAIERVLGTDPHGSTASLVARLSASLNDDGTFKASALLAAGLIALPITNSMVGASAAIEESKLDLNIATQVLQNQINSNDVDILALQDTFTSLINDFNQHVGGSAFKHDSFDILLDSLFPSSTPPSFTNLTSTTVGGALIETNNRFLTHVSASTLGAHQASNVSVDSVFSFAAANVQDVLEGLDNAAATSVRLHQDDQHSSGFSNWANTVDGYNTKLQLIPSTLGTNTTAYILPGSRNVIDFTGFTLASIPVSQGDVVLVKDTASVGFYQIDDIGPRNPVGSKAALLSTQLEIVGTFPSDGYVSAQIFGKASVQQFKTNVAATIHQSDIRVDSVQVARPNSAKILSLGINPRFVDATSSLDVEVGIGAGAVRTLTINNLHFDRAGAPASPVSVTTIVERINSVFQNRVDGNAFPAAAYRVGDELMLSHNWDDDETYTLRVLSTGGGNFELGLDGYGANLLDVYLRPSINASYYVAGQELHAFKQILDGYASVAGQVFTFSSINPLEAGVKIGHLLHLKTHPTASQIGTYFIIGVSSNSITIHKNAGVAIASSVLVEVWHDALPLDDFTANTRDCIINTFIDFDGRLGYSQRLDYNDTIANLSIVDVSDNFIESSCTLTTSVSGSTLTLTLASSGTNGPSVLLPTSSSGQFKIFGPSNIEYIVVSLTSPVGSAISNIEIHSQIDEEEVLEICTVRLDGVLTVSNIVDKRLFGTTGLDEIREDYTQANIELPLSETRSSGFIVGFDIMQDNYQDLSLFASNIYGVLLRGGTAYVGGVRLDVPTAPVMFPNTAGTYYVVLNSLGTYSVINNSSYTLEQLIDGYAGTYLPTAKVVHSGAGLNPLTSTDLRFFINNLDDKVELIVDATNRRIGNFGSFDAAISFANNYPYSEKFRIRIVSFTNTNITVPSDSRPITIEIDGSVGSVTVASTCRIMSTSPAHRVSKHILGSLVVSSACTNFLADNIRIAGNVSDAATISNYDGCFFDAAVSLTGSLGKITSCKLGSTSSGLGANSTTAHIAGCDFTTGAGAVTSISENLIISGCRFANATPLNLVVYDALISDSIFNGGFAADGYIVFGGSNFVVNDCLFTGYVQTTRSLVLCKSNSAVNIDNCIFESIQLSSTHQMILSGDGSANKVSINGCQFVGITSTSSPMISCSVFTRNLFIGFGSTNLIKLYGPSIFSENKNFSSVTTGTSSSDRPALISNNIFSSSTLGYNIDVTQSSSATFAQATISGNHFSSIQNDGILCGANTTRLFVIDNYFDGAAGTGINFGAGPTQMFVRGNVFKCLTAFSSASPIISSSIDNNYFAFTSGTTLQIGGNFRFCGNISEVNSDFTFTGTTVAEMVMEGNSMSSIITLSVPIGSTLGFSISSNVFAGLVIGANMSEGSISGNAFAILSGSGAPTLTGISFSGNIMQILTSTSSIIWQDCNISGNTYSTGSAITFKVIDGVTINNNVFSTPASLTLQTSSGGAMTNCAFSNNICNGVILTISDPFDQSVLNGNTDLDLIVSDGMNSSVVVGNSLTDGYFGGAINNVSICDNYINSDAPNGVEIVTTSIQSLIFMGNTTTRALSLTTDDFDHVIISNNKFVGGAVIVATNATAADILISDNVTTGSISIDTGITSNLSIHNNRSGAGLVITASVLTESDISFNKITTDLQLTVSFAANNIQFVYNVIEDAADISSIGSGFSRLNFIGNTVLGELNLPPDSGFNTGTAQSKFFFNYAGTWASSGTLDTSAAAYTRLFPWGNTGNGTDGSVTFGGTTAVNVTTANNLSGGIDT